MQQLQAWANKGWYTFPCKKHPEGDFDGDGWEEIYNIESNFRYNLADAVDCVLDGTIQVWRPVDKYEPPNSKEDFLISVIYKIGIDGRTKRGYRKGRIGFAKNLGTWHFKDGKGDLELDSIATHYQPLPQPPQEVSHV
jgi:hypothetical protein